MNYSRRIAVVLTMMVLGAVTASAASASSPAWIVEGSALGSGATEAIAETTKVTQVFAIKTSKWGVECSAMKLPESLIEGERTRKDKAIRMESCISIGAPKCEVPTITLQPLTSTLEGTEGHYKLFFKPTSGTTVAKVNLSGSGCGGLGIVTVTGTMACNYPEVEFPAQNHVLEFSLSSGSALEWLGEVVTLTGHDEFWLASNKKWWVA